MRHGLGMLAAPWEWGNDIAMSARSLRGRVAVAGIGETEYFKHGRSPDPEFKLALKAILAAAEDAGIDPREIDGFASYSNDRNEPSRIAAALGVRELRFSNMQWGGGGGGGAAAVGNAAAAIATGLADCVVVFRALAQGQFQRQPLSAASERVAPEQVSPTAGQVPDIEVVLGQRDVGQRFRQITARP